MIFDSYNMSGVMVLNNVTPVITALFGAFNMKQVCPDDNGRIYITQKTEDNTSWHHINDALLILSSQLGLLLPKNTDRKIKDTLYALATYFNATQHEKLTLILEDYPFDSKADLYALFILAVCFDDGHGLQEIRFEGGWKIERPQIFGFGGNGAFLSREIVSIGTSSQPIAIGEKLRAAILNNDTERAADIIFSSLSFLLLGIHDNKIRTVITAQLANQLQTVQPHLQHNN
ncbi:hypothetical protein [Serratia sp. Ag2]|uniref:hypothetical protein n=1 Tax=Serratia sp. Ag2 TaxID=1532556 RepID=UPI0005044A91|nr:hypothetical protein [Serratia sp. Ag2]KFK91757.1 hypothetical protein JV45_24495 [Serratia sp. Ag2]